MDHAQKKGRFFGISSLTPPSIEGKTFQEFHNQYEMVSSICLHPVYIFQSELSKKITCRTQIVPGQLRQTLVQRPSGRKVWLSNSIDVHRLSIHSTISSKTLKLLLKIKFFTFDKDFTQKAIKMDDIALKALKRAASSFQNISVSVSSVFWRDTWTRDMWKAVILLNMFFKLLWALPGLPYLVIVILLTW